MTYISHSLSEVTLKVCFLLSLIVLIAACKRDDDEQPENCEHFEYEGENGPAHWEDLCIDWLSCGGASQSPINIANAIIDTSLGAITTNYNAISTHIHNNGHTIEFKAGTGGTIVLRGETYKLKQFHIHTDSEHRIGGESFLMEMPRPYRQPEESCRRMYLAEFGSTKQAFQAE